MNKDAKRIGIYGGSGSGKSTLARQMLSGKNRVVVFDPLEEYGGPGRYLTARTLKGVLQGIRKGWRTGFRVAFVPRAGMETTDLHRLSVLLTQVQDPYKRGSPVPKITLVVEEMNLSFPVGGLPAELDGFPNICSRGRHWGIEVIGISQRVAEVNTRFRGNTDEAYFLRQMDHRSVATICQTLGPAYRDRLKALDTGQYLRLAGGHVTEGRTRPNS